MPKIAVLWKLSSPDFKNFLNNDKIWSDFGHKLNKTAKKLHDYSFKQLIEI